MTEWIEMPLGREVGLSPSDIVFDGNPVPLPKKGDTALSPQFSACVYCGQTAGWIKVPLGMELGLGPRDIVFYGDPLPLPKKGAEPGLPIFDPFLLWPNGCMLQDITWYGDRPQPRGLCVR